MMAFDHVFWDLAKLESRAIQTVDHKETPATFVFRELYCADPGCDCRRVVLHVHWVEKSRVAASINYAFEPSRRRDEPQISLDPLNPQSEYSERLLAAFTDMIANDGEYRERLRRHYTMWKEVVDDPSHPDHAKVRGEAHLDPSFRPAFPRKKGGSRRGRDSAGDGGAGSQSLGLVSAKAVSADNKLQQRFKRLLQKVDHLRARAHAWKEARPNIDREISAFSALFEQQGRLNREMVSLIDRSYTNAIFSKSDRKKLAAFICSIAGELIEQGGHDELKPTYNRYSGSDFDEEAEAVSSAAADELKAMMETFGIEFGAADVGSMEKLKAFAEAQAAALEREREEAQARRAKRKKSAKQVASEARRADEQRGADKAVQEVYRALALAWHPDREQDPEERARKAELMCQVNVAHEAKDLLRLLELQLQLEQVDVARIETLAEDRIRHYVRLLDEQSRRLAMEVEELDRPFRLELGLSPSSALKPSDVVAQIHRDADVVRQRIASLARDLSAFEDVRSIKAWLKAQARSRVRGYDSEADLFG